MGTELMTEPIYVKSSYGGIERGETLIIEGKQLEYTEVLDLTAKLVKWLEGFEENELDSGAQKASKQWIEFAKKNTGKWGFQGMPRLLLSMTEELGELTQAYLEWVDAEAPTSGENLIKYVNVENELQDLAALCFQLRWRLNGKLDKQSKLHD